MSETPPPPPSDYPPAPPAGAAPAPPLQPSEERTWAILSHVGGIILGFIAPLITYLVFKDRGPFIRHHSAQALNFQLTVLIGYIASGLLMFVLIGFLTYIAVWVLSIVFAILAGVAASRGEWYKYPISIPFLK